VGLLALLAFPAAGFSASYHGLVLPEITGPIPGTPYNVNGNAFKQIPMKKLGYGTQEYFVSGKSNVYEWKPNDHFHTTILRSGNYTTRIVVHKPQDPKNWDGTAVVEIVNMTGFGPKFGFDYPAEWANNWREITRQGMAYIGITSKPNVFPALRRYNRKRYAPLEMANPLPAREQTCGTLPGNPKYDPNLSKLYENGLIYDAFTQLGTLLHSNSPSNPLDGPAKRVYLLGLSQSADYLKTYLRFVAPRAKFATGEPVFDGYRTEGAVPALSTTLINQCATPLLANDPQNSIPDRGVPLLELHSSADYAFDLPRKPDSPWYRRWEVAGTFHDNTWTFEYALPNDGVFEKSLPGLGISISEGVIPNCESAYPPDPPYQDLYDSSLRALDRWVRLGIRPPHAPYLKSSDGKPVLDKYGNQLGGIRLPAVAVPVATYHAEMFEPVADCSDKVRFSNSRLLRLYPRHGSYVNRVRRSLARLVARGFLTPEDAGEELAGAARSSIP
jgi:hypothetical protein